MSAKRAGERGSTGSGVLAVVRLRANSAPGRTARLELLNAATTGVDGAALANTLPAPLSVRVNP